MTSNSAIYEKAQSGRLVGGSGLLSYLPLYILLGFCALTLIGCQYSGLHKLAPINVVPPSSLVVLSVNWTEVQKDDYLKRIVNGDEIGKTFLKLNLIDNEVNTVVVFSDAKNQTSGSTGIILSGSYNTRAVINKLKTQGWTNQIYRGYKVYCHTADNVCLAGLRGGLLVVGTMAGVEAVIDVELNPQTGFASSQPFNRLISRFGKGRYPISIIIVFPEAAQDIGSVALEFSSVLLNLAGLGPLGELLKRIGFAEGLGYSISRSGNSFPVELVAIMKDETAAGIVSSSLNLLKRFTTLMPREKMTQSEIKAMETFQNMSVTRNGEILSIKMVMTEKDLM